MRCLSSFATLTQRSTNNRLERRFAGLKDKLFHLVPLFPTSKQIPEHSLRGRRPSFSLGGLSGWNAGGI